MEKQITKEDLLKEIAYRGWEFDLDKIPNSLMEDKDVIMSLLKIDCKIEIPASLKQDKEIGMFYAKKGNIKYICENFADDKELILTVIANSKKID